MALSKHTTAGTQGKGDGGSWGSMERDRRGGHEVSSCNLEPLFLHSGTIMRLKILEQTVLLTLCKKCKQTFKPIVSENTTPVSRQVELNKTQPGPGVVHTKKALGGLVPGNSTTQIRIKENSL